jgi:hypothetical protein
MARVPCVGAGVGGQKMYRVLQARYMRNPTLTNNPLYAQKEMEMSNPMYDATSKI